MSTHFSQGSERGRKGGRFLRAALRRRFKYYKKCVSSAALRVAAAPGRPQADVSKGT